MSAEARVEDVGYARYEGERRGRAWALWSLARFGALSALGARRGWRAKLIPIVLIVIAFTPALIVLGVKALFNQRIGGGNLPETLLPYGGYYTEIGFTVLLFAGLVAPELLCPDRLDDVLSLLFSTAVDRIEYVLGRLLGVFLPLAGVTLLPVLTLFAGNVVFAEHPLGYLEREWATVPRILLAGSFLALYFSLLGLAVASLTKRRTVAMGTYVGIVLVSSALAGILSVGTEATRYGGLLSLLRTPIVATRTLFDDTEPLTDGLSAGWYWGVSLAVMAVSLAVLASRYLRTEA